MKKILEWFNRNWMYFLIVGVGFILTTSVIERCSVKQANSLVEQSEFESWKRHYKDSVDKSYIVREIDSLQQRRKSDSIKTEYWKKQVQRKQIKINQLETKIIKSGQEADDAVTDYENDTTHTEKCDSAISKLITHILDLKEQNDTLKSTVEDLGCEAERYSNQLHSCEQENINYKKLSFIDKKAIEDEKRVNQQLRDQIKKDNNWWRRNQKWFYFGAGVVVTGLILK